MEKTKKLFAYVVAFVAIVSLFIAGISVQGTLSYAKSSTQQDGEFTSATATIDGVAVPEGAIELVFNNDAATTARKAEIAQIDAQAAEGTLALSDKAKEDLDALAKTYDTEADNRAMQYAPAFVIELKGAAQNGAKVEFDLTEVSIAKVEFALFKAENSDSWTFLQPVEENGAANAVNKNGGDKISFNVPGSGAIVFGSFSQAKANEVKAADAAKPCCTCCGKSCPFCSFLCKDGKCYCWTMYVVIVLAAILLVLLVALIIVKAKAKKVTDVQEEPAIEVVDPQEEAAPVQQPEENKENK